MPRIASRRLVQSIIQYLNKQELKATYDEQLNLRVAGLIIEYAYYQRDAANAYTRAVNKMLKAHHHYVVLPAAPEQLKGVLLLPSFGAGDCVTLVPPPPRPPEVWWVDGRNGRQWVASIEGYLSWRAGKAWRRVSDRFDPRFADYDEAIYILNHAFNFTDPPPPVEEMKPPRAFAKAA